MSVCLSERISPTRGHAEPSAPYNQRESEVLYPPLNDEVLFGGELGYIFEAVAWFGKRQRLLSKREHTRAGPDGVEGLRTTEMVRDLPSWWSREGLSIGFRDSRSVTDRSRHWPQGPGLRLHPSIGSLASHNEA